MLLLSFTSGMVLGFMLARKSSRKGSSSNQSSPAKTRVGKNQKSAEQKKQLQEKNLQILKRLGVQKNGLVSGYDNRPRIFQLQPRRRLPASRLVVQVEARPHLRPRQRLSPSRFRPTQLPRQRPERAQQQPERRQRARPPLLGAERPPRMPALRWESGSSLGMPETTVLASTPMRIYGLGRARKENK